MAWRNWFYCSKCKQTGGAKIDSWSHNWCTIPSANSRDPSIMLYNIWFFIGVIGRSSAESRRGPCTASRNCSLLDAGDDTATIVFCTSSSSSSSLSDDDSLEVWRLSRTAHTLTTQSCATILINLPVLTYLQSYCLHTGTGIREMA